jgi:hypothetical protein
MQRKREIMERQKEDKKKKGYERKKTNLSQMNVIEFDPFHWQQHTVSSVHRPYCTIA